jgi:hypothetical protein
VLVNHYFFGRNLWFVEVNDKTNSGIQDPSKLKWTSDILYDTHMWWKRYFNIRHLQKYSVLKIYRMCSICHIPNKSCICLYSTAFYFKFLCNLLKS